MILLIIDLIISLFPKTLKKLVLSVLKMILVITIFRLNDLALSKNLFFFMSSMYLTQNE